MQSTDFFAAAKKARELLITRIELEKKLHLLETEHKKAILEHQAAMEELQKIIYESKK